MNVTVFEDPCPKPGQSIQERLDKMLKEAKRRKKEQSEQL